MKRLLKIKYMAIQWDNYQGGSGRPFEDEEHIEINGHNTVSDIERIISKVFEIKEKDTWFHLFKIISVQLICIQ